MLEAAAWLFSALIVWWLSAAFIHPAWSWIALLQFLWLCVLCFRSQPQGFALFLPIVLIRASVVVALVAIEYGAHLPEVGLAGTPGPHTASYVVVSAWLFACYLLAFGLLQRTLHRSHGNLLTATFDRYAVQVSAVIVGVGGLATLWLIFVGGSRGFPLLAGVDRFVFRRIFADPLTLNILNFKSILASALGLVTFCLPVSAIWKRLSLVTFLVFVGINFLFGDKFFIILMTVSAYIAPYLYRNHQLVRKKAGMTMVVAALVMAPVMGVTWFIYSDQGRMSPEATTRRLTERFAAQGELWYVQNRIGGPLARWDSLFVSRNIEATGVKNVDLFALRNGLGPAYFMNLYAPDRLRAAQGRHAGLVTYTMALEPLLLVHFGWLGLAIGMAFSGGLFALGALYLAYAIERRLILSMIFAGYIMVLMRSFSTQGGLWVVASVFTLKWFSVVLAIELALLIVAASQGRTPPLRRTPGGVMPAKQRVAM